MATMAAPGASRSSALRFSLLFSFFLFFLLQIGVPSATAESHAHHNLHLRNSARLSTRATEQSVDDAQALVKQALVGISADNKHRLNNPSRDKTGYRHGAFKSSRTSHTSNSPFEARSNAPLLDYTIPESVIIAAKTVAESSKHTTGATAEAVAEAEALKAQYWPKKSDTEAEDSSRLDTRATAFWMEAMTMNGLSPFATSDYVVSYLTEQSSGSS
jgi:hypothetical protein